MTDEKVVATSPDPQEEGPRLTWCAEHSLLNCPRHPAPASPEGLDYGKVLKLAKERVNSSVLYKRFIDGTPLENDIAVWMADFVLDMVRQLAVNGQIAAPPPEGLDPQRALLHPAHQVFFRAGLIACREYMARFVEPESPAIAMSIRANWWPSLGQDFGPPRQLAFAEVTSGEYGAPDFRVKTADEVSPTLEALPIALGFLQQPIEPSQPAAPPRAEGLPLKDEKA